MKIVIEEHKFDTSKAEKNYQLECMTDDIMAQAELLCNPLKTEGCGDAQVTALVLMQSLGRSALFPQLLAEAKKWKAKAIEERAIVDFGRESERPDYHIDFVKIPDEGEDDIAFGDVYIPTSKRGWKAQAARELEEEMKDAKTCLNCKPATKSNLKRI